MAQVCLEPFMIGDPMKVNNLMLDALQNEFSAWQHQLQGLENSGEQIALADTSWTLKDVLAHLWAWQQVTLARLQAGLDDAGPVFPDWLQGGDPDSEPLLERYNDRIYRENREIAWQDVLDKWRNGFAQLIALAKSIPVENLEQADRYSWLKGYALSAVLEGTLNHHREHFVSVWPGTPHANKIIVRQLYEEGWGEGDLDVIKQNFASPHVLHWNELNPTDQQRTPEEVCQIVTSYRAAFPDLQVVINDLVAEEDKVVVMVTFSGTHSGLYEGFAPTNKQNRFTDMQILRLAEGKIAESWLASGGLAYFFAMLDGSLFNA